MTGFSFGSTTTQTSPGGGLFGNNSNTSTTNTSGATSTGGLFGSSTTAANSSSSGGLFGSTSNTSTSNSQSTGLFGSSNNNTTAASTGGLFGSNTTSSNNNSSNASGGLFGNNSSTNNNTSSGSLFGNTSSTNNNTSSGSLFGNNTTSTTSSNSSGLFGSNKTTSSPAATGSLFGNSNQTSNNSSFGTNSNNAPTNVFQNTQQINQNLTAQKLQLVSSFLPYIFYMNASTLTFRTVKKTPTLNEATKDVVKDGDLPEPLMKEMLQIQLRVNETERLLEQVQAVPLPDLQKLEALSREMTSGLKFIAAAMAEKEPQVMDLVENSKASVKHAEKVLHETRRCNNNYNLSTFSNLNNNLTELNRASSRYVMSKAIPSEFFIEVLIGLEKKLKQSQRGVELLERILKNKGASKAFEDENDDGMAKLGEMLRRQYNGFLAVAGMISKVNKKIDIMREQHVTKFGDDFKEFEQAEKRRKERRQLALAQDAGSLNVTGLLANALNPPNSNNANQNSNSSNNNSGGGLFGSNSTSNTSTSSGLFGSNNNSTSGTSSGSTGSLFCNNNATSTTNSGTSLFGNNNATSTTNSGTSLFGNNNASSTTNSGTSLFGNNNATSTTNTGTSLFGNSSNNAKSGGSLFGGGNKNKKSVFR